MEGILIIIGFIFLLIAIIGIGGIIGFLINALCSLFGFLFDNCLGGCVCIFFVGLLLMCLIGMCL